MGYHLNVKVTDTPFAMPNERPCNRSIRIVVRVIVGLREEIIRKLCSVTFFVNVKPSLSLNSK